MISTALEQTEIVVVAASSLRGMVWPRKKLMVHLIGGTEIFLTLEASPTAIKIKLRKSRVQFSQDELVEILKTSGADFVFCNASNTKELADALPMVAFGWNSACVDQGATLLAAAFYKAVSQGATFSQAYLAARQFLEKPHSNVVVAVHFRESPDSKPRVTYVKAPRFTSKDPCTKRPRDEEDEVRKRASTALLQLAGGPDDDSDGDSIISSCDAPR